MSGLRRKQPDDFDRDEDSFSRQLDTRLIRRLVSYARPQALLLAVAAALLLLSTSAEIAVPYVLMQAIDEHIEVRAVRIDASARSADDVWLLKTFSAGGLIRATGDGKDVMFLTASGLRSLDPALRRRVERSGKLGPGDHHVFEVDDPRKAALVRCNPEKFTPLERGFAVKAEDLTGMGPAAVGAVRARDLRAITMLGLFLIGLLVARFVLYFGSFLAVQWAGQLITHRLRMQVFSHMQRMSLRFFDRKPVGTLVTRGTVDVKTLEEMFVGMLLNLFSDVYMLAGLVAILLYLDWKLSLAAFAILPLLIAATMSFRSLARRAYRLVRAKVARINAFLSENISGIAVVQVFNRQAENLRRFREINEDHFRARLREVYVFAVFRPLVEIVSAVAIAVVLWYGGSLAIAGAATLGTLVAFISYVQKFFQPIQDISEKYNLMQAAMASSERIFQVLDEPEEIADPPLPVAVREPRGRVEFRNVWFAYEGEDWVLKDVSFSIEPGSSLALVGQTGAGKSTIVSLLGRYWDVTKGQILVDGVDVRNLSKSWLRSRIGMVMQDVFLFAGDIRSNIRLRNTDITDDTVVRVAEQVMASRFIERLPNRYVEMVRERGSTLSAGERQLLAFARALAFDPGILVLDEATANVDSETESLIEEALRKMMEMRTCLIIAHRLSTIKSSDRILVLQDGAVVESGSHQELLSAGGTYKKLWEMQARSG